MGASKCNHFVIKGKVIKCGHFLSDRKQEGFRLVLIQTEYHHPVPFPLFGHQDKIIEAGDQIRIKGHFSGFRSKYIKYCVDYIEVITNPNGVNHHVCPKPKGGKENKAVQSQGGGGQCDRSQQ